MIIICGYPGVGTNRYRLMLQDLDYTGHKQNYETHNYGLSKHLDENTNVEFGKIYTCHNLTITTLRKHFPKFEIHKLWTQDFYQSLHRFYDVFWKNETGNTVESAFDTIVGNVRYYEDNIPDKQCDVLIDIDNDTCKFSKIIRDELYSHTNKNFEQALLIFKEWGPFAPVTDIVAGKDEDIIAESFRLNLLENE